MVSDALAYARSGWESIQERLFFLPPFPDQLDSLALFSLLLPGVFHRTRLPGCTIPRLSKRRLAITSPIRHIVRICINIAEDLLLVKSSLTLP